MLSFICRVKEVNHAMRRQSGILKKQPLGNKASSIRAKYLMNRANVWAVRLMEKEANFGNSNICAIKRSSESEKTKTGPIEWKNTMSFDV